MSVRAALLWAVVLASGCDGRLPGRPAAATEPLHPDQQLDFSVLYGSNCAGCHGPEGLGGASVPLGDPVYLAFADDAVLTQVTANGVPGTAMPAFAQSAGGMLAEPQVQALVRGMRSRWGKPDVLRGAEPPPYAATQEGDAVRGAQAYATFCASCHGPTGRGGSKASSIVDGTYLALVSPQHLRTTVLVGRPDWAMPDWRSDVPGRPMTAEDVSDVVAWLSRQRPAFPGQPYPSASAGAGVRK
jgi:cytochrome c oxidase cbb3-type subunit III